MKKVFKFCFVILSLFSLLMFSCGGGGGAGGATAGTSSGSSSGAGGSAVSIRFNGLYARSAGTVWDTIDYLDLKIFVDGEEVFSKHLTASDNVVLVEHLTPGSTAYAAGSLKYNEINGGNSANIQSDTITLERGSNTLTLNVVYTFELFYYDANMQEQISTGTYTAGGGISLPQDFCDTYNTDIFTGWLDVRNESDRYPKDFAGVRGNIKLRAIYEYIPESFSITYHFERNGQTVSTPTVYTYAPSMLSVPDYPYTSDIKLIIDSITPNDITDYYLDPVDPLNTVVTPTRDDDNNIILNAIDYSTASTGMYVLKSNDGRVSNEKITVNKVDTIRLAGDDTIDLFNDFAPSATDIRYVVNNTSITSIGPNAVPSHVQSALTWLELIGTSIEVIPEYCFQDCAALTTVMLPSSITVLRSGAFSGCIELQSVFYDGSLDDWNYFGPGGWAGLETCSAQIGTSDYNPIVFNGTNWEPAQ